MPTTIIVIAKVTVSSNTICSRLVAEPSWPRTLVRTNSDTNAPTMNTSPWAKLISSMIP